VTPWLRAVDAPPSHSLPPAASRARSHEARGARVERALHVAALPFPSPQGTQAAISAMLKALADAGDEVRLLTYAHGTASVEPPPFAVLRAPERWPYRSLRSGPSLHKLAADVALARGLSRVLASWQPTQLVAHHVEAAALTLLSGAPLQVFFAHTDLAAELPTYAANALWPLLERCGGSLDRELLRRSGAVAAVSPWLAERLRVHAPLGRVRYVPVPWTVAPPIGAEERARARAALGLRAADEVLGYAGNLDAYQGWPVLIELLVQLRCRGRSVRLLVATSSAPEPLWREALRAGAGAQLSVLPLATEADRRRVHAAIDLALVPRRVAGGVSIKLLDALGRGVPCVVSHTASAGLPLSGAAVVAAGDSGLALVAEVAALLNAPQRRAELRERGPSYVARAHAPRALVRELRALTAVTVGAGAPSRRG
jgi:glycosyltransferase involved in cell wall biosynthesis